MSGPIRTDRQRLDYLEAIGTGPVTDSKFAKLTMTWLGTRPRSVTLRDAIDQLMLDVPAIATCIGCGCTDISACHPPCSWLRVDREVARGVCSSCPEHVKRWDAGDRVRVNVFGDTDG